MTAAELIAELSKLPPHTPIFAAIEADEYEATDIDGELVCINMTRDLDCLAASHVVWEGTYAVIVGDGMVPDSW